MKILQVITDTDHRGAQVSAVALAPALEALGHDVVTVALAPGGTATPLDVEVLGRTRLGLKTLRALRARARQADVVIAHGSTTLPACAGGLLGTGVPFVYRQISDSQVWASTPLRRWRVRLALRRAAAVVALGERQSQVLITSFGVAPERVRVIANAVAGDRFAPTTPTDRDAARAELEVEPGGTVVAVIGALVPEKRVERVIAAVARLDAPAVQLLVVGHGPEEARLRGLADRSCGGRARFVGSIPDVLVAYRAADLLVLASATESMPTTLIEAALCGLPVVATDVGSVDEIVVHGLTGLVVADPVDPTSDDRLLDGIAELVADPDRRLEMGVNARARAADRFTVEVVAAAWDSALSDARGSAEH